MHKLVRVGVAFAALSLLVAAIASGGADRTVQASDTLVYGASADPVVLDPALISDGESFRVNIQIYETLVTQRPGTTQLVPGLATGWKKSAGGRTWTFTLRRGVAFHDGTPFNAAAVCANFNRWYNFKGAQASSSASYYYNVVFGGFKKPGSGYPGPAKALYRDCKARGQYTVVIRLKRVFGPFLGAMTLGPFAIASPAALKTYQADKGRLTPDGVYQPLGKFGVPDGAAVGTGPFKFDSWRVGDRLTIVRNDDYWGKKAFLRRVIFRPIADNAARLQALQTGEIQGYDNVEPQDIKTIQNNRNLKVQDRPSFNVGYVTINQAIEPFDNLLVRKAVAHGLNRPGVVTSFYGGRGTVAHEFQPPAVLGYSNSVPKYPYNPARAKELLTQAGVEQPLEVEFWWPTDVSRPYMPNPKNNFQAFAESLNRSGFKVVAKSAPWRPDYLGRVDAGTAGALNLIGWTGDYADPESFLGGVLRAAKQFGLENNPIGTKLYRDLDRALATADADVRAAQYRRINNYIMAQVIGVPYVHTKPALAFRRNVVGYKPSPTLNDVFSIVRITG
jgi:peptide/nickel transport system substrate-binding protein